MLKRVANFLFPEFSEWQDVYINYNNATGYVTLLQERRNLRTNKKQLNVVRKLVNDYAFNAINT